MAAGPASNSSGSGPSSSSSRPPGPNMTPAPLVLPGPALSLRIIESRQPDGAPFEAHPRQAPAPAWRARRRWRDKSALSDGLGAGAGANWSAWTDAHQLSAGPSGAIEAEEAAGPGGRSARLHMRVRRLSEAPACVFTRGGAPVCLGAGFTCARARLAGAKSRLDVCSRAAEGGEQTSAQANTPPPAGRSRRHASGRPVRKTCRPRECESAHIKWPPGLTGHVYGNL